MAFFYAALIKTETCFDSRQLAKLAAMFIYAVQINANSEFFENLEICKYALLHFNPAQSDFFRKPGSIEKRATASLDLHSLHHLHHPHWDPCKAESSEELIRIPTKSSDHSASNQRHLYVVASRRHPDTSKVDATRDTSIYDSDAFGSGSCVPKGSDGWAGKIGGSGRDERGHLPGICDSCVVLHDVRSNTCQVEAARRWISGRWTGSDDVGSVEESGDEDGQKVAVDRNECEGRGWRVATGQEAADSRRTGERVQSVGG